MTIIIMLSNNNYHLQLMNGTQFYLELLDRDSGKNDLIDRFAINISVPVNSFIERANYSGVFGMAMLEVSFYVISNSSTTVSSPTVVTSTESGPTAVISPTVAISTESGPIVVTSTESGPTVVISPTVVTSIDNNPTTESNQTVITSTKSGSTAVISPTVVTSTESTLVDIDNGYELLVTINSYGNPTHRCAGCTTNCCDGHCNRGCDTYFYLCVRPFQTISPESPMIIRRDCPPDEVVVTESERNRIDGTTFNDTVLGVANPIIFSKIANVSHTVAIEYNST